MYGKKHFDYTDRIKDLPKGVQKPKTADYNPRKRVVNEIHERPNEDTTSEENKDGMILAFSTVSHTNPHSMLQNRINQSRSVSRETNTRMGRRIETGNKTNYSTINQTEETVQSLYGSSLNQHRFKKKQRSSACFTLDISTMD